VSAIDWHTPYTTLASHFGDLQTNEEHMTATHEAARAADTFADASGMLDRVDAINARLEALSTRCHLCSPSTTCALPPGCAASFTLVRIDPATESHSVGGGRRSLLRTALLKLANAAGISWDARASGRVDPGTDPRVVHWHAAGAWRGLDGTVLPVVGDCQMDLRDNGDQALEILANARGDTPQEREAKGRRTLLATRAKILEHAQSKAELRAIRKALGIRSYTEAELRAKPFAVVRLVYLGHDEDPDVERENKRAIRAQMLGGVRALFGPPAEERVSSYRALPPAPTVQALPPASNVHDAEVDDAPPERDPEDLADEAPAPACSGFTIPGGRSKGTPIEDADDSDLSYWGNRLADDLAAGNSKPQFRERDEALVAAIQDEQQRRAGTMSIRNEGDLT
jgi:hypothetical protein